MEVNKKIFEAIYFGALTESCKLAQEFGPYSTYHGSPASQGILQMDMWGVQVSDELFDWTGLRNNIKEHGLRNSLLCAPMPTASTAQILNNPESLEPIHSNLYTRRVISGEYCVVNSYLVDDLKQLGLWDHSMKDAIVKHEGSIQEIEGIPQDLKDMYKTAYEIDPKIILQMAADRSPFIDQSQSLNAFFQTVNTKRLSTLHFYAWGLGLKTGMYYLRTKAAASAAKVSICESCSA
jgi:ribonucleoside-diphosphate reductase subunit M1